MKIKSFGFLSMMVYITWNRSASNYFHITFGIYRENIMKKLNSVNK